MSLKSIKEKIKKEIDDYKKSCNEDVKRNIEWNKKNNPGYDTKPLIEYSKRELERYIRRISIDSPKREAFVNKVVKMDNKALYYETFGMVNGDDYDGGFTDEGAFQSQILQFEFESRLEEIGFL